MKRVVICFILVVFSISLVFSSYSNQKYYAVSSVEWNTVNDICHIAGVAGPSSNGPITAYQLSLALDRAEKELGPDNPIIKRAKEILGETKAVYEDELGFVSLTAEANGEVYLQSNGNDLSADAFDQDSDWFIKNYRERPAFISLTLENGINDILYSRLVLQGKQKQSSDNYWDDGVHFGFYGARMSQNFPFDAGISIGTKGFSIITGRGKVSLGEGYTGNTAIGDNYDYQEFMKMGFYTRNTGVNLTLTSFDSSRKTTNDSTNVINNPYTVQNSKFSGYREIRHSAEYEMTIVDKLKLSLVFITLLDTDTAFDFRYLNPFMMLHNMYNFHEGNILEANNMIAVDISWAVAKKVNLYLQVTMDQFQITGEADGYTESFGYTDPNAFSGLINLSYTDLFKEGIGRLYLEAVYTAPGMYLNQKYYDDCRITQQIKEEPCWSQDYLLGYSRTEAGGKDDMAFSGYIYGPDAIVLALGGEYYIPKKLDITSRVLYMAHGEKGRGSNINNYNFSGLDSKETINTLSPTGVVEHTFALIAECDWTLSEFVSLYGGVAYSYRWNYRNENGRNVGNFQTAFGVKLSYTV